MSIDIQASLYQQFDPARALDADEPVYVDWQKRLGLDDVKRRLVSSFALAGPVPTCRLLTGHRGVGKTTELKRVKARLEQGVAGRRYFVSLLQAEQWMDLNDVGAADVVLHVARQLVEDFKRAGIPITPNPLGRFVEEVKELMTREVELRDLKVAAEPFELGITLKDVPHARPALRRLLEGRLPTLYHLINDEVLRAARDWLAEERNGGYAGIVVMLDELDRIPQKVINAQGLTNHENLFLDHAGMLRFLACDLVYTIPIELAYSSCRARLTTAYSAEILALPLVPVVRRDGAVALPAMQALRDLVLQRLAAIGVSLEQAFGSGDLLDRLCLASGGHVRGLFILLRSSLERAESLPLSDGVVERALRRQAVDLSLPLGAKEIALLREVHDTKRAPADANGLFDRLLKDLFVLAYEDEDGAWYDCNPLLASRLTR